MSSNKKFRIQNGVDITGQLIVGGRLVIDADGTIAVSTLEGAVTTAFAAEVTTLQTQIDALLEASPESLDTLQEIVALFQSEDNDLSTLISQNAAAIAALQAQIVSKTNTSEVDALTTSMTGVQSLLAVEETTTSGQIVYMAGVKWPFSAAGTDANIYCIDAQTGNLLSTIEYPEPPNQGYAEWGTVVSDNDQYVVVGLKSTGTNTPGRVFVYQKDSSGLPSGTPTILTSPSPASSNIGSEFGNSITFVGDYLFVGEQYYNFVGGNGEGRVSVFQVSTGFQFVRTFNMSDGTGDISGGHYGLGNLVVGSGDYAIFGISYHEELPYPSQGVNTGQIWIVDTNNINSGHITLNPPQQINSSSYGGLIHANDTHFMVIYNSSTVVVYETSTRNITHTSTSSEFSTYRSGVSDSYAAFWSDQTSEVYAFPSMVKLGTIPNPATNGFSNISISGSKVILSCASDKCAYIFDIESSLTVPVAVIVSPDSTDDQFGYLLTHSSVGGIAITTVPTLETTSTTVVGAINELNATFSSLSGGTCIDYNASTGVISVDEADAAANLHVATSSDTNSLDGQDGDYYRLDVYDANDTIIN